MSSPKIQVAFLVLTARRKELRRFFLPSALSAKCDKLKNKRAAQPRTELLMKIAADAARQTELMT